MSHLNVKLRFVHFPEHHQMFSSFYLLKDEIFDGRAFCFTMEVEGKGFSFFAEGGLFIGVLLYLVLVLWGSVQLAKGDFLFVHGDLMKIEVIAVLWLLDVDIKLTWLIHGELGVDDGG